MNLYLFYHYFIPAAVKFVTFTIIANPLDHTYLEFVVAHLIDEAS